MHTQRCILNAHARTMMTTTPSYPQHNRNHNRDPQNGSAPSNPPSRPVTTQRQRQGNIAQTFSPSCPPRS
jgi:hypothetical protein